MYFVCNTCNTVYTQRTVRIVYTLCTVQIISFKCFNILIISIQIILSETKFFATSLDVVISNQVWNGQNTKDVKVDIIHNFLRSHNQNRQSSNLSD